MMRAISTRKGHYSYEKLREEHPFYEPKLWRSSTTVVPETRVEQLGSPPKKSFELPHLPELILAKKPKKSVKSHPLFDIFSTKSKKKTSREEFSRYLAYVREGEFWDSKARKPLPVPKSNAGGGPVFDLILL